MAWTQQIGKEFAAAENSRGVRSSMERGIVPHVITGCIPLSNKYQLQKERLDKLDMSPLYSTGMPFRAIYSRRNNPEGILRLKLQSQQSSGLVTPKSSMFHRFSAII